MELRWSKEIQADDPWEPYYEGAFCKFDDKIHYFFRDGSDLSVLAENSTTHSKFHPPFENRKLTLPHHWILVKHADHQYLFLDDQLAFDIRSMTFTSDPPLEAWEQFSGKKKPEKYYVEASFIYDEYCISHKGHFGYVCKKNGLPVWSFKGQGYLYTDIYRFRDRLYFGTGGQGGYFYVLDLETGEPLAQIKTGGTASIVCSGPDCYVLSNDQNTRLLCVDLNSGKIKDSVDLPGKSSIASRLQLIDGTMHAITFEYRHNAMQCAIWNSIEVSC